jgi:hypothetical protein
MIIFGAYFGIREYDKRHQQRRLIDELTDQNSDDISRKQYDDNGRTARVTKGNNFQLTQCTPALGGILSKNTNQVKPLVTNNSDVLPPTSVSVTMFNLAVANSDDSANAT